MGDAPRPSGLAPVADPHRSPSYRPATCCNGCDCAYGHAATAERPCWGPVAVTEEWGDGEWLHTCEGHRGTFDGDAYRPEAAPA